MQVNSGNLDNLLDRLIKIGYFGLDFLNTFLMTFPLFTDPHTVFDFLEKNYWECMHSREKRRGSVTPLDAVRDARGTSCDMHVRGMRHACAWHATCMCVACDMHVRGM